MIVSNIEKYKSIYTGNCLVIGHGESRGAFPISKVQTYPKLLVNFYDPLYENIIGIMCWDKDTLSFINKQLNGVENRPMIFTAGSTDMIPSYNFFIDPEKFPPRFNDEIKIFSGARAIYLAQYMGFENIYLIGFDFIPHKKGDENIYPMERESIHYKDNPSGVHTGLKNQLKCFDNVKWIHTNIYQTNTNSLLINFEYKLPEELNG
ncbi:MAG: hypothetical protein ACFFDN_02460 [Candidatus Hodarchaeota archaeon]